MMEQARGVEKEEKEERAETIRQDGVETVCVQAAEQKYRTPGVCPVTS